jgi:hypothetical protein
MVAEIVVAIPGKSVVLRGFTGSRIEPDLAAASKTVGR